MDDQNWDDYLRQTPGTTFGDQAREAQKRSQPEIENLNFGGASVGGYSSAAGTTEVSDTSVRIFLALLCAAPITLLANIQFDLAWGWGMFFGLWVGLSIAQFIWPVVHRVMGYIFSFALLATIAVFIYRFATA